MAVQAFFILLLVGLILFGAEIFVPGAILGIIGTVCLLGAIVAGFIAFPGLGGYIAIGIVILVGVAVVLWVTIFPKTSIGKKMTVSIDLAEGKASDSSDAVLLGKEGEAVSELRPSGYALFENRRVDVLTRGEMISKGSRVKVVHVEGKRVFVTKV